MSLELDLETLAKSTHPYVREAIKRVRASLSWRRHEEGVYDKERAAVSY